MCELLCIKTPSQQTQVNEKDTAASTSVLTLGGCLRTMSNRLSTIL